MNISEISGEKKDQLRHELSREPANNFAIAINGKQWKVFKGKGRYAEDQAEERQFQQLRSWAKKKSDDTGKKWTVAKTGAPASESVQEKAGKYGNPEKGVQVKSKDSKPKKIKPTPGNESPHPMRGKLVGEADEPTKDKGARATLNHSLLSRGHKVVPDKKKALKKGDVKHRKSLYQEMTDLEEGPLVLSRSSDLMSMLDVLLKDFKSKHPSDEEIKALLKSLGYVMTKDGERTTLVKEDYDPALIKMLADYEDACQEYRYYGDTDVVTIDKLLKQGKKEDAAEEMAGAMSDQDGGSDKFDHMYDMALDAIEDYTLGEGKGDIRKGLAAIALIASMWGVNNHMAQQAYDASPQLQKLTAYLEVAKQHNDQRMIDQLEQRIENHKTRIDIGKGEVMGKDGRPVDVKYDKDVDEAKQRLDPKCWKGYKKQGTKMKGGVRVNNCVPK